MAPSSDLLTQVLLAEQAEAKAQDPFYRGAELLRKTAVPYNASFSTSNNVGAALIQGLMQGILQGVGTTSTDAAMTDKSQELLNLLQPGDEGIVDRFKASETYAPYAGNVALDQYRREQDIEDENRKVLKSLAQAILTNRLVTTPAAKELAVFKDRLKRDMEANYGITVEDKGLDAALGGVAAPAAAPAGAPTAAPAPPAAPAGAVEQPGSNQQTVDRINQGLLFLAEKPGRNLNNLDPAIRQAIVNNPRALDKAAKVINAQARTYTKPTALMKNLMARNETATALVGNYGRLWKALRDTRSAWASTVVGRMPKQSNYGALEKDLKGRLSTAKLELAAVVYGSARTPEQLVQELGDAFPAFDEAEPSGMRKMAHLNSVLAYADAIRQIAFGLRDPLTAKEREDFLNGGVTPGIMKFEQEILANAAADKQSILQQEGLNAGPTSGLTQPVQLPGTTRQFDPQMVLRELQRRQQLRGQ